MLSRPFSLIHFRLFFSQGYKGEGRAKAGTYSWEEAVSHQTAWILENLHVPEASRAHRTRPGMRVVVPHPHNSTHLACCEPAGPAQGPWSSAAPLEEGPSFSSSPSS